MARGNNDKKRLLRAATKRQELFEKGELSPSPDTDRHVGILVAASTDNVRLLQLRKDTETIEFIEEAKSSGYEASLRITGDRDDALLFIGRRAITDLVFVGHGQFSHIELDDENLSWWHLARHLDHIKQGNVIQRHCGLRWSAMNIALGTFAVTDMRNVISPVGREFVPQYPNDNEANSLLVSAYDKPNLSYEELVAIGVQEYDD